MPREVFIDPTRTIRIDLPGGGWIEIKEKLSNGESKGLQGKAFSIMMDDSAPKGWAPVIDNAVYNISRILTWVVDWDFTRDGKAVAISKDSIAALDPIVATEIEEAIDAHVETLGREKNALDIGSGSVLLSR